MVEVAVSDVLPPAPVVADVEVLSPLVVELPVVALAAPPVVLVVCVAPVVFAAPVVLVVCVVPFEVLAAALAATVDCPVVAAPPVVPMLPAAVGVPSLVVSSAAGSLLQLTRRVREVSERKKREGVRLSIAFLKGKRTESLECRLSKAYCQALSKQIVDAESGWRTGRLTQPTPRSQARLAARFVRRPSMTTCSLCYFESAV